MIRETQVQSHQLNCQHSFEVKYPGILERCIKCKVWKWIWVCWKRGLKQVDIGNPGNWKLKELELRTLETKGGE